MPQLMENNKQRKRQKELYDFDKNWIHIYFLRFKCNLFTSFNHMGLPVILWANWWGLCTFVNDCYVGLFSQI